MSVKSFEQLLVEGAVSAVRTLTLEELYATQDQLDEMDLPEEVTEFPRAVLNMVIAEKQSQRAMN